MHEACRKSTVSRRINGACMDEEEMHFEGEDNPAGASMVQTVQYLIEAVVIKPQTPNLQGNNSTSKAWRREVDMAG